jgi:hypothetical protein
VICDSLSSHTSVATRIWLAEHSRIGQVVHPKGAGWLNLQQAWWRLFRRQALAGRCLADAAEVTLATRVATRQLDQRARPWVWGRTPLSPRPPAATLCVPPLRNAAANGAARSP